MIKPLMILACCLALPAGDDVDELMEAARQLESLGEPEMAARKWGQALEEARGDLLAEQRVSAALAPLLDDDPDQLRALEALGELETRAVTPLLGAGPLAAHVLREAVRRNSLEGLVRPSLALIDFAKTKGSGDVADLLGEWGEGMHALTQFEVAKAVKRLEKAWEGLLEEGALEDGLHVAVELAARMVERRDGDEALEVVEATLAALQARGDGVLLERWTAVAGARFDDDMQALRRAAGLGDGDGRDGADGADGADGQPGQAGAPGGDGGDADEPRGPDGLAGGRSVPAEAAAFPAPTEGPASPAWAVLSERGRSRTLMTVERDEQRLVLTCELDCAWTQELPLGPGVAVIHHGGVELLLRGPAVALGAIHPVAAAEDRAEVRERLPLACHAFSLADGETWKLTTRGEVSVR